MRNFIKKIWTNGKSKANNLIEVVLVPGGFLAYGIFAAARDTRGVIIHRLVAVHRSTSGVQGATLFAGVVLIIVAAILVALKSYRSLRRFLRWLKAVYVPKLPKPLQAVSNGLRGFGRWIGIGDDPEGLLDA